MKKIPSDMLFIELVCWVGLLFFFWTWKGRIWHAQPGSDTQATPGCADKATLGNPAGGIHIPEGAEPIGHYRDMPIYRHVLIDGKFYQFDCIDTETNLKNPGRGKRRIAPGLIYEECRQPDLPISN